jgi:alpha-acetolactate decarboxylase
MICTPRTNLATRVIEGEVVILDKQTGRIHQLNSTASFVWTRLDSGTPLAAIVSEMVRNFEVEEDRARADVADVAAELVRLELVSTSESEPSTKRSSQCSNRTSPDGIS